MKFVRIAICLIVLTGATLSIAGVVPFQDKPKLSLELESIPLPTVLNMIAQQNDINIVVSGDVTGDITMRLVNVDIAVALEAILAPNGYNYYIKDDVVIVKSAKTVSVGERITRVITLLHADPAIVSNALETHKSAKGEIVVLGPSNDDNTGDRTFKANRLMITDIAGAVEEMMGVVGQLDVLERLVSIEVKIIETKVDANSKLGIAWPTSAVVSMGGGNESSSSTTSNTSSSTATYNPNNGDWTSGTLSMHELLATLDFLQREGNSRLVSDPHIITVENRMAEIKATTIIPIPTINRFTEGAATQDILTFYDEEIGLSLEVTPRISEGNRITLDVFSQVEEIIGYSGPVDNQKPITTSRSIKTRISVDSGETAVLGGLLKENEIEIVHRVPLLGSIPLLGKLLFTHKSVEKSTTDLMILITPKIMP